MKDPNWPLDIKNKEILEYIQKENDYTAKFFAPLKAEETKIREEIEGRIKINDQSPYEKKGDYYYYTRMKNDTGLKIYCRKYKSTDADEEIILDTNDLVKNNTLAILQSFSVSPDSNFLAYEIDFTGTGIYKILILDLKTKNCLKDEIEGVSGSIIWHQKLKGFFYQSLNNQGQLNKVMFHTLGKDVSEDKLIFKIDENMPYTVIIHQSASENYMFIYTLSFISNEVHFVNLKDDTFKIQLIRSMTNGMFYDVNHCGNYFYIRTNDKAENYKIVRFEIDNLQQNDSWIKEYVPENISRYLVEFEITKDYLILTYRENGLTVMKVKDLKDGVEKTINFPEAAYLTELHSSNFKENDIRIRYSSLSRPDTVYTYSFSSDKLTILAMLAIPSNFDSNDYTVKRIYIENLDVKVPISILYKTSLFKSDGSNPLYLYGYGSYGVGIPAGFSSQSISLANRGFVYAIAHVRGGDDLNEYWHESAKLLNKKRTFDDFIASAEALIKLKYTSKGNIVCSGNGAGATLVGVAVNEKPELFKAAIMESPFVDVLNSLLDDNLPSTTVEFSELGNPKELEYFNYIKSYSPYDNIKAQSYPHMLVTGGFVGARVSYWEEAKWVAKLRKMKTDSNEVLLKLEMESILDHLTKITNEIVFILKVFKKI